MGSLLISTEDLRKIFITGHLEYDRETLLGEYRRDKDKGLEIQVPINYFPMMTILKNLYRLGKQQHIYSIIIG